MAIFLRSLLFNLFFLVCLLGVSILGVPALFLPRKASLMVSRGWVKSVSAGLKFFVGVTYHVEGAENIPPGACIIASKHQSAWETFFFLFYLKDPAMILKRQLMWLPFYGWYVWKMDHVPINRGGRAAALKAMVENAKQKVADGRQILVFPQGTRIAPSQKAKYQSGVAALYLALDVPVVPVALNSGKVWGKRQFVKKPGLITVRFLPALPPGLEKKEFMKKLEHAIESQHL